MKWTSKRIPETGYNEIVSTGSTKECKVYKESNQVDKQGRVQKMSKGIKCGVPGGTVSKSVPKNNYNGSLI